MLSDGSRCICARSFTMVTLDTPVLYIYYCITIIIIIILICFPWYRPSISITHRALTVPQSFPVQISLQLYYVGICFDVGITEAYWDCGWCEVFTGICWWLFMHI